MGIIRALKMGFDYKRYTDDDQEQKIRAVDGVDLEVQAGEFIAILGHNGSGKSTFAKHINALLLPTEGAMIIDGVDTSKEPELWRIRQKAGMVFQNPDNQIISTVVEDDVAFGPENLGVPEAQLWERMEESLRKVGMYAYREKSPNRLSGGQKQRVAIAGIVAMRPKIIIFDEPTAMLDPTGRKDVLEVAHELCAREKVTIILITHYMEEVIGADRVFVMDGGRVALSGTPREVFSRVEELKELRLDVPDVTDLAHSLKKRGLPFPDGILTREEFLAAVRENRILPKTAGSEARETIAAQAPDAVTPGEAKDLERPREMELSSQPGPAYISSDFEKPVQLELENVTYAYSRATAYETKALDAVSLKIFKGQFIGVIGHTGSGKSTLIQHFNGLMRPTEGRVLFEGQDIWEKGYDLRKLRTRVGMVFQFPESQLFETDVLTDCAFGPKNQGFSIEEAKEKAKAALHIVGIGEEYYTASPFELSGGQKRRVAIAGVLAMEPDILILDEPTAGLDPKGRDEILDRIRDFHDSHGITIVLVSHSMEDVATYADRLIVVQEGRIAFDDTPSNVFARYRELEPMGLAAPQITYLMNELAEDGYPVDTRADTIAKAEANILKLNLADRLGKK